MTSLDTATREVASEGNEGASKIDASTRRSGHRHHHRMTSPTRTSDRESERERYLVYDLDTTRQELERLRDRVRARDLSRDRLVVRERSRERSDVRDVRITNRDGLRLEGEFERQLRDRYLVEQERELLQHEYQRRRRMRRHFHETEREKELDRLAGTVIIERKPDEEEKQRDFYRRLDGAVRKKPATLEELEEEILLRKERPGAQPTNSHHHFSPSPPRPRTRPTSSLVPHPRPPDLRTTESSSTALDIVNSGSLRYEDRPDDDDMRRSSTVIKAPTATKDRRSSSDSTSAVLRPVHRRPRSAFSSPVDANEFHYHAPEGLHRRENDQRTSLRSNRSDDTYEDYVRPTVSLGGRRSVIYLDEDLSAERRRAARHSAPSISIGDYAPVMPRSPRSAPTSLRRTTASPATRASSPAKIAPISTSDAAKPTDAEMPIEDIDMREKLLDVICPHSPDLVHRNLVNARAKDSGKWLLNLPVFEKWRGTKIAEDVGVTEGNQSNCVWLSGNIGAGKTMLMSAVIDDLLANVEMPSENKSKKTAVLYYYFNRSTPSSPRDAIASLLRQLCSQKDVGPLPWFLAERLAAMKKAPGSKSVATTAATDADKEHPTIMPIGDMIADFISLELRFDSVYICLDGLEECDDLVVLFELLVRLASSSSPSRLAISTRPQIMQPGIAAGIGSKDMVVDIDQYNAPDIRSCLETFAEKHDCFADMIGAEALPEHVRVMTEKSGGNFLAATVEIAELNRLTTAFDVNQHMNRPSVGFSELFSLILSRLDDQPAQRAVLAKRIFYWLSVSRRGLTLKELQQAVAIEPEKYHGSQVFDVGEKLPPPSLIEKVCMGFIRVDTVNDSVFVSPSALPFYLYQFNESFATEAREYASKCCVGFLHSEILSHGAFKSQTDYDEMERKLPFSRYVAQHWGTHLNDSEAGDMHDATEKLLENVTLMDTMSQLLHVNRPASDRRWRYDEYPSGFGAQHFGAYFRLGVAFRKWTSPRDWEAPKDSWGRKPLHVASLAPSLYTKHVIFNACKDDVFGFVVSGGELPQRGTSPAPNVEELPLASGDGDSNYKYFRCESVSTLPWTWASAADAAEQLKMQVPFGREEMVILDNHGRTPLHHFIVGWSEDRYTHMLNTLFDLQHSSEEDSDTGSNLSANEVNLLPTFADQDGRTILDRSCLRNVVYVSLVFTASAWSSGQISSAIAAAATDGHLWPLKRLLELAEAKFGAEALNLDLKAAVIEASKRGFTDIVRMLRQQGAELGKPEHDKGGMTALHYAAYGSHLDTVRYLLLEGADPNQLDEFGRSPLFCASESGNKGIVSLLIEKGASPNAINSEGFSSLQLAARNGNLDVVKKLLRFLEGGDKAAKSKSRHSEVESKSPFHLAAQYGHNDIIQLLLDEGLPCDSKDSDGRTPLSYACQAGVLSTVRLLLAQKVDVNAQDSSGRTALSYAAACGYVDIVIALMGQSELNPSVVDCEAKSPLIHAAQQGHGEVVTLLAVLNADSEEREAIIRTSRGVLSKLLKPPICHKIVDLEAFDDQGRTARDYLRQTKNHKAIEFLDTMRAYRAHENLNQPAVSQGEGLNGVLSNDRSETVAIKRDLQDNKTIASLGRKSTQGAGPSNLEAIVVNKIELHPVAEENEDTEKENDTSATGVTENGNKPQVASLVTKEND